MQREIGSNKEMVAVWELLFFRYTSAVLALLGSIIGIVIYLLHDFLMLLGTEFSRAVIWCAVILVPALAGYLCGKLIHNLNYWAHRNQLTHLWNSRYFYSKISKEIKRLRKKETSLCVALIDLDDFKIINDTYGHSVGDEVLRSIATILEENTRDQDIVVRWGGDEFVIIFPDTNLEKASLFAERLREMIEGNSSCFQATISVGILVVEAEVEVAQLFKMVDETLYKAKKSKNLVVSNVYD